CGTLNDGERDLCRLDGERSPDYDQLRVDQIDRAGDDVSDCFGGAFEVGQGNGLSGYGGKSELVDGGGQVAPSRALHLLSGSRQYGVARGDCAKTPALSAMAGGTLRIDLQMTDL